MVVQGKIGGSLGLAARCLAWLEYLCCLESLNLAG